MTKVRIAIIWNGFLGGAIATILFKLAGVVTWSWWAVTSPLWLAALAVVFAMGFLGLMMLVATFFGALD